MTNIPNQNFPKIKITHVPTATTLEFDSYMERFSDNFNSQWESTDVFGRMDDIKNFKRTTRTIDLGWTVISENSSSAAINYSNCSTLMAMLYPVYSTTATTSDRQPLELDTRVEQEQIAEVLFNTDISPENLNIANQEIGQILTSIEDRARMSSTAVNNTVNRQTSVMSSPPIFKINFANLIRNSADKELYGTIEGFKYEPDLEMGFFIDGTGDEQMMYPKVISLSFAFTVIHTSPLGWEFKDGSYKLRNPNFPFYKKR